MLFKRLENYFSKVRLMKILYVTNIPSPYRAFFFDQLAKHQGLDLKVVYCASNESDRKWSIPEINHRHVFLPRRMVKFRNARIYFQFEVLNHIESFNPDLVITGGFSPTMLLSMFKARRIRSKLALNTDAWEHIEEDYSRWHIRLRKLLYPYFDFFFPVSKKGAENIIKNYRVTESKVFCVPYVIDQRPFRALRDVEKEYDLIFSGQLIDRKIPLFFTDVVLSLSERMNKPVRVVLLGSGPMQEEVLDRLTSPQVILTFPGFVQKEDIPTYFCKSKVFLFPTKSDGWGVVSNEAIAAGIPSIISRYAGAADDIVQHDVNGYVLENNKEEWVEKTFELLTDHSLYARLAKGNDGMSIKFDATNVCDELHSFLR